MPSRTLLSVFFVLVALLVVFARASADGTQPPGPVYESEFGTVFDGTVGAGGGTITVWLTPDSSAVTRVDVEGLQAGTVDFQLDFSRDAYFVPPRPFVGSEAALLLPVTYFGMAQAAIEVQLQLAPDGQLGGTGRIVGSVTSPAVPFTATGPSGPPPPVGMKQDAQIEGQDGTLAFVLNKGGDVGAFALDNVSLAPCYHELVTMQANVKPGDVKAHSHATWVIFEGLGLQFLSLHADRIGDDYSGTLSLSGTRSGDCGVTLNWTTGEFPTVTELPTATGTPLATSTPQPGLPPAGSGPERRSVPMFALAALAAAGAFLAAGALIRIR